MIFFLFFLIPIHINNIAYVSANAHSLAITDTENYFFYIIFFYFIIYYMRIFNIFSFYSNFSSNLY